MVAEFFRREGWDVFGVVGGAVDDPAVRVRKEWADVVGLSIGSRAPAGLAAPAASPTCARPRATRAWWSWSAGRSSSLHPDWVAGVGADATARDARDAPRVAARLLMATRIRR